MLAAAACLVWASSLTPRPADAHERDSRDRRAPSWSTNDWRRDGWDSWRHHRGSHGSHHKPGDDAVIVFNGEGNNLNAYDADPPFVKQNVIPSRSSDPNGLDINAQICFFPDGSRRFIAGEDTGQPDPPPGWGIFQLYGNEVGKLRTKELAKLTPTYSGDDPRSGENYGCGFLSDGRIVTSDIGNQASGPPTGQLIVWFPPFNTGVGGVGQVRYCKLDVAIATAGQIFVDDQDRIYVASSRDPTAGVLRYSGPYPTSDIAAGGCGKRDATGAPLATTTRRERFITAGGFSGASGIVPSPSGGFYISTVAFGKIDEYDANGTLVRPIMAPLPNEGLGNFSKGTPLGLAIDSRGTLYYADIDLAISQSGIGPGRDGKVRRIRFVNGVPQAPEIIDRGLAFPDALGVLEGRDLRRPIDWHSNFESRDFAYGPTRTFFNAQEKYLNRGSATTLREKWRFHTDAIITSTPAVARIHVPGRGDERVVFFNAWDGHVYAVRFDDGKELWRFRWDDQPGASYPGASSPTVARVGYRDVVIVGAGETVYALDARTGRELWRFAAGTGCTDAHGRPPGSCGFGGERNEVESSPIVADGKVYFGMDVNESVTGKGGMYAVDVWRGTLKWYFDTSTGETCRPRWHDRVRKFDGYHSAAELGLPANFFATRPGCGFDRAPNGCGGIWSSASIDRERHALFIASTNCYTSTDPSSPRPRPPMPKFAEALFSLDLDGTPRWSWRPREIDNADLAFGGAPNLFSITVDGVSHEVVGVGNKDGTYYVVGRDGVNERTGVRWDDPNPSALPYWSRNVVPGGPADGIPATAAVDETARRVYFTTAAGSSGINPQRPTVHVLNLDTGAIVWQNVGATGLEGDASFGPASTVPGLLIVGSTLSANVRVYDTKTGKLLLQRAVGDPTTIGGVASGAVVIDGTILVGSGIGQRSSNPESIANVASNSDSSLVALCVPGSPTC
jgi:outer membrane protein assembly factor BamB